MSERLFFIMDSDTDTWRCENESFHDSDSDNDMTG